MPVYIYSALDQKGQTRTGAVTAPNRAQALEQVAREGLHPVSVEEEKTAGGQGLRLRGRGGVGARQVEVFTRELGNLLAAGVPLGRALRILVQEATSEAAKEMWAAVHEDVLNGVSLADALSKWPRAFSPVNVAMVRAGEAGGFLDVVLGQIADFRAREQDLLGRVKSALTYPAILTVLMLVVLTFLLTYFIPKFQLMFAEFGGSLPFLTQLVVSASRFVLHYGYVVVVAVVLSVLVLRRSLATDAGRRFLEKLLLGAPAVGNIVARFALVRFCRMLGTLLQSGVPLVASLKVAREAIGNQTLADAVDEAIEDVKGGTPLARSLARCPRLFPPSVIEMLAVAEESGRLEQELLRQASSQELELDRRLRMLVAVTEPAVLFIMAGVVGTIVVGMLLPIFTLQELIR